MRRLALALFAAVSIAGAGCAGTYTTSGTVVATSDYEPELVHVSPGVSVIADYDEPVFHTNNTYWRYYGGRWYRSGYHNRGWAYIATPPVSITRIERPYAYRHYRPEGHVRRDVRPARHDGRVRDHRR